MPRIFDTEDAEFAKTVAGISYEEFVVFQELDRKMEADSEKVGYAQN